jgi:hypothetical protein
LEGILNGSMNLVDLDRGYHLKHSNDGSYQGVTGTFCHLDFEPHKKDPSKCKYYRSSVPCIGASSPTVSRRVVSCRCTVRHALL